jgi:hypothetical protein
MTPKTRMIRCLDIKDGPRCPQPQSGEDTQTKKAAVR